MQTISLRNYEMKCFDSDFVDRLHLNKIFFHECDKIFQFSLIKLDDPFYKLIPQICLKLANEIS